MALEIKQSLKLSQQLVITPQLQQAIKLLQLSRLELQTMVQNEILENPILEEMPDEEGPASEEEVSVTEPAALLHDSKTDKQQEVQTNAEPSQFDWENYLGTYNTHEGMGGREKSEFENEPPIYENMSLAGGSLQDHLLWQLNMSDLEEKEKRIIEDIIAAVNDEGYFQGNIPEIAAKHDVLVNKVEEALESLQEFDPPGVAARDLKECLKIQIRPFSYKDHDLLEPLIENHLEDLEKKNYPLILKNLKITSDRLKELAHLISTLEPKPGRPFGLEKPQYIIPDVFIEKVGEEYIVFLNDDGLPKLQVSSFYRTALHQKEMNSQAKEYIQDKLRSALWLIKSIHQRQRTLYKVTHSIMKFQKDFLEHGITSLKPLVLRDVADDVNMHESTISRVTTNKYVQTPRGLFELKFFFNARVPCGSSDGMTPEAIKEEIKKMVAGEDVKKPLSDQAITEILQKKEIEIARRTVAKYREMLGILPAARRKEVLY